MTTIPKEVNTRFFKRMKEANLNFKHIVDIGCYRGMWTELAKQSYPDAQYYLIDANDKFKTDLEKLGYFYCEIISEKGGKRKFHYSESSEDQTGSSLYEENSNVPFKSEIKNTKKLSEVLPKNMDIDFIKMDVQGAELEIIEGSLDLFMKTKFIQLECPVHPNNKEAPLFEHYINYMANCNFKVFDINSIFYNGKLMAVDFIFVNKNLPKVTALEQETLIYNLG
jgi:FkbM family methyltransferase